MIREDSLDSAWESRQRTPSAKLRIIVRNQRLGGTSDAVGLKGLVPVSWQIKDFVAILPLATISASHFLLPIVLNPGLMRFSY